MRNIDATGLPVGVFCNEHFAVNNIQMEKGDALLLYTDGLSEARDHTGVEYGIERLAQLFRGNSELAPRILLDACVKDLDSFRAARMPTDDLTLMVIRRTH